MNGKFKIVALSIFFAIVSITTIAQTNYSLDGQRSNVTIKGTSTLHDWEMKAEEIRGSIILAEEEILDKLTEGNLSVTVKSINSDQSLMNKKAHEALKEEAHPLITAKLLRVDQSQSKVVLDLSIAGITKKLTADYTLVKITSGSIQVKGELDIKMSDYNIKPPVALLGTIKTGDEVKVVYDLSYHK